MLSNEKRSSLVQQSVSWAQKSFIGSALDKEFWESRRVSVDAVNAANQTWIRRRHDIQHNATQHNDIEHNDIQQNDIQHNDIQHNDIQHNDIQHIDIQHYDILHNDIQHNE